MKKVLFPVLVAFLAIGCSQGEGGEPVVPETGTPISFGGDYGDKDSRTTYEGPAPTTMLWSSYDNIGVYTFNASGTAIAKDECTIKEESYGQAQGYFTPNNLQFVEQWVGENTGDIAFRSYYPLGQNSAPAYSSGVAVSVPEVQSDGFGHYQICCATTTKSTSDLETDPNVTFAFTPVTTMIRLFFYLTDDSDVDNVVIKEASVSTSSTGRLFGSATLDFTANEGKGGLTTTTGTKAESKVTAVLTTAISVGKLPDALKSHAANFSSADFAAYAATVQPVDIVALPMPASSDMKVVFKAVTNTGLKLNSATIPTTKGFKGGLYYNALCPLSVKVDASTPDASYVDGGEAWGDEIQPDGSYMDNGTAW